MANYSHVEIRKSARIDAPAAALWELVTDWAGISRWWLSEAEGGRPGPGLVRCELLGHPNQTPRTRRVFLDNGATTDEALLHQNDESRCLYYNMADNARVQNYLAVVTIDELDEHCSAINLASRFDVVPKIADVGAVQAGFELIYEKALFNGFRTYFARQT